MAEEYLSNIHCNRLMAIHALNRVAYKTDISPNRWMTGQLVWLEGKNLPLPYGTAKLSPRRHGPFKITKIISPVAVQLKLPTQWNIHLVFHTSLLTPYTETPSHGPNFTRPPPNLIDGEEEYEVEQICSHQTWGRRKTLQYLIKWKGYPESDNTWEDADQIHAPMLIKLYHQRTLQDSIKGQRIQLEGKHSSTLSPPKAFSRPLSLPTILRDSTAALVWSSSHKRNIRSACNPLTHLAQSLLRRRTQTTLPSSFAMSTGNLSTLQTSTANSTSSPSAPLRHAPDPSIQCHLSLLTTPQTSHHKKPLSNSHRDMIPLPRCHSRRTLSAPHFKPKHTSTTICYTALLTDCSRPSPIER
jgi:Chromo (CHRromatin Organisation MOdifier) domain